MIKHIFPKGNKQELGVSSGGAGSGPRVGCTACVAGKYQPDAARTSESQCIACTRGRAPLRAVLAAVAAVSEVPPAEVGAQWRARFGALGGVGFLTLGQPDGEAAAGDLAA